MRRTTQTLAYLLALALCQGCREQGTRVTVSGVVTQDGQPIQEGKIMFTPAEGTNGPAAGTSIENGRYRIPASQGPGTGDYVISVTPGQLPRKKLPLGQQPGEALAASPSFQFTRKIGRDTGDIDLELSPNDEMEED